MNVIYNAFYSAENKIKSPNLKLLGGVNSYLKSCYVSLKTAKLLNPQSSVVLVTNKVLPDAFKSLFLSASIEIEYLNLNTYKMPSNFKWEYAFYKLEALAHMVECDKYENILALDTDTYVSGNLDKLWEECKYDVPLLLPLDVECSSPVRKAIINDYLQLYGEKYPVVQIGGEFIAGSRQTLQIFSNKLLILYQQIRTNGFKISESSGDEALISMVMAKENYNCARAFVGRYWGRRAYYNVSSDWVWTPIWHLPAEKNYGLIKMFEYLVDKKNMPCTETAARLLSV